MEPLTSKLLGAVLRQTFPLRGILLAASFILGCGVLPSLGDPTRNVVVHNATGEVIDLYTYQRDPDYRFRIGVGESLSQGWMFPISPDDHRVRRVEADNLSGGHIFCLDVTYEKLVQRNWRVEIVPGATCGP